MVSSRRLLPILIGISTALIIGCLMAAHAGTYFVASGNSWATWDQKTETGLASHYTFVSLMKSTVNGSNETGQGGGLEGANLTLTQSGTVSGATEQYRILDGVNDAFTWTTDAVDSFMLNSYQYTLIWKFTDLKLTGGGAKAICYFYMDPKEHLIIADAGGTLACSLMTNTVVVWAAQGIGTDTFPTTGDIWIYVTRHFGSYKVGWDTVKRVKWSQIPSTRKISASEVALHSNSFATRYSPWCDPVGGGYVPLKARYFIASKKLLLSDL